MTLTLRPSAFTVALLTATTLLSVSVSTPASAMRRRRRSKPPAMNPELAAAKRDEVEGRARMHLIGGNTAEAARVFDEAAQEWGDPILLLQAGEAWLTTATSRREAEPAHAALERSAIALDVLHFHRDSDAPHAIRLVHDEEIEPLIERAEDLQRSAQALIDELRPDAAPPPPKPPNDAPRPDRSRAMMISGAVLGGIGVAGIGVGIAGLGLGASHQQTAEDPTTYGEAYDDVATKGERANVMAIVGWSAGGALLLTGVTLLVVGRSRAKTRKPVGDVSFSPQWGPHGGGGAVAGRF